MYNKVSDKRNTFWAFFQVQRLDVALEHSTEEEEEEEEETEEDEEEKEEEEKEEEEEVGATCRGRDSFGHG
ncbi:hypothetical protein E2C01_062023 [Portunus trituberculatus]|uniref:Uncharacterized protein n=1 Tax=Portunus trituberculatus TaxID=210409 RepID=A0A5B7HET3_PORTR|nr:hypothetical protein [Portunus trituberculatus]